MDQPKPPAHLSREMKTWWKKVTSEYHLQAHHLRLLQAAAEAWDRAAQARETLATTGMYFADRFGAPHAHPAVAVERDSRAAFARLLRALALEDSDPTSRGD